MKAGDVNPSIYVDFNKENNKERSKFKVLQQVTFQIGLQKSLLFKKSKTLGHGHLLLVILTEKKSKTQRVQCIKQIEGKGDKLYVKWKGYENSCNSW